METTLFLKAPLRGRSGLFPPRRAAEPDGNHSPFARAPGTSSTLSSAHTREGAFPLPSSQALPVSPLVLT